MGLSTGRCRCDTERALSVARKLGCGWVVGVGPRDGGSVGLRLAQSECRSCGPAGPWVSLWTRVDDGGSHRRSLSASLCLCLGACVGDETHVHSTKDNPSCCTARRFGGFCEPRRGVRWWSRMAGPRYGTGKCAQRAASTPRARRSRCGSEEPDQFAQVCWWLQAREEGLVKGWIV